MNCNYLFFILLVILIFRFSQSTPIVWIGAVTPNSFLIHVDIQQGVSNLVLSSNSKFSTLVANKNTNHTQAIIQPLAVYHKLRKFTFINLKPQTKYYIGAVRDNRITSLASVRTFPENGDSTDITFAFASCQASAKSDDTFNQIRKWLDSEEKKKNPNPFFFIHMGDLHYSDIDVDSLIPFQEHTREVLKQKNVHRVFSSMPVPYMYDDHDYGVNNAGYSSKSRNSALGNYRNMVPSYPLLSKEASYHAFTVGSVRFIITDTRALSRKEKGSTLGTAQREWLFEEFRNAKKYRVVVWMTSKPWIGPSTEGDDSWNGYPVERRNISRKLAQFEVNNLIAIAGDAHMIAADDGSNTDYTESDDFKPAGFPIFQAAPIAHFGSSKGGPYSEGCFAYRAVRNKQYGVMKLTKLKNPEGPCIEFSGIAGDKRDRPKIQFRRCGKLSGIEGTGGQARSCSLQTVPTWIAILLVIGTLIFVTLLIICFVLIIRCVRRKRNKNTRSSELLSSGIDPSNSESP